MTGHKERSIQTGIEVDDSRQAIRVMKALVSRNIAFAYVPPANPGDGYYLEVTRFSHFGKLLHEVSQAME